MNQIQLVRRAGPAFAVISSCSGWRIRTISASRWMGSSVSWKRAQIQTRLTTLNPMESSAGTEKGFTRDARAQDGSS